MKTKQALSVIESLMELYHKPLTSYFLHKKKDFEYHSLVRSAMKEIQKYLLEHLDDDPFRSLEEFSYIMDDAACTAQNESANFMFSTYCDTATYVYDTLLCMKYNV